ncbi:MAG: FecR family protein [Opitutaceae bacterium]
MLPPTSRGDRDRQASVWAARLESGPLDDAGRQELAAWLEAAPDNRDALAGYRELCADLAAQVPLLADADEVGALADRVAAGHRWRRRAARGLAVAAVFALGVGFWWLRPERMETRPAERRTVALADGSRIELNARTRLQVSLSGRERRIGFAGGEAFFRVAHDPARPFLVETRAGVVRVTGTAFNVRETTAGQTEVTVLEGMVQARAAPDQGLPEPVGAGCQGLISDAGVVVRPLPPEATQGVIAWRVGQAAFESEPLGEAIGRFTAYHSRGITVAPEAAVLRVGGRYSLDDLDGFLAALEQALPVAVLHAAGGEVRIVSRPPRP